MGLSEVRQAILDQSGIIHFSVSKEAQMMPAAATHCVVLAGGPPFLGCLSGWGLQLGGTQVEPNMAHWGIGL